MRRTILLVDDDPKVLRLLEATLRLKGFDVAVAEDGPQALAWLAAHAPDLVVADTLEGSGAVDGWTLFRAVRDRERGERVPFVFLSSAEAPGDVVRALRLGADEFLRKPFALEELLVRIERLLATQDDGGWPAAELQGSCSQLPLPDLVNMMGLQQRTGWLRVRFPGEGADASLHFRDGVLYHAEFGLLVGRPAVFQALARDEGTFAFVTGDLRAPRTVDGPTLGVLMDGFRLLDEGRLPRIDPLDGPATASFQRAVGRPETPRFPSAPGPPRPAPPAVRPPPAGPPSPPSVEVVALSDAPSMELAELDATASMEATAPSPVLPPAPDGWGDAVVRRPAVRPPRPQRTPFLPPPPPPSPPPDAAPATPDAPASGVEAQDSARALPAAAPPEPVTSIVLVDDGPGPVETVYRAVEELIARRAGPAGAQISTLSGRVLASTLEDRGQRDRIAAFTAQAHALRMRDGGGAWTEASVGRLHLAVAELPGRRLLALVYHQKPDLGTLGGILEGILGRGR